MKMTPAITPRFYTYEGSAPHLTWPGAVEALRAGHHLPKAQVADMFLGPSDGSLLSRGAFIEGFGFGMKSVTVFGENPAAGLPSVQGAMLAFEPENGQLYAVIESRLVTEYKTAADSVLGASLLARPDSTRLLIVGGGTVARSLVHAYRAVMPQLTHIEIWARNPTQGQALAAECDTDQCRVSSVTDLAEAAAEADIISTATMARDPILKGAWISPGTHVDLIGAFKPDMREADDALIAMGRLFVDSRETTLHHIGELMMPLASGAITEDSVLGDFYDLVGQGAVGRQSPDDVTVFKNGGGAHLDLMIAGFIAGQTPDGVTDS